MFYCPADGGFYDVIDPIGVGIELTTDEYQRLLESQSGYGFEVDASGTVIAVSPPANQPLPTDEQLRAEAVCKRDVLLTRATLQMAPLQDAIDIGDASDTEVTRLSKWKRYRVDLNRIQNQEGYPKTIDWPVPPTPGYPANS